MESKDTPYWHNLLSYFEIQGYNGLTIPFLVGIRGEMEPEENLLTIGELIHSIDEIGGTILYCSKLKEFVIGTIDYESSRFAYPQTIGKILITDDSLTEVENLEDLILFFEGEYQGRIDNEEYSKNQGKWGYFTEGELALMKKINSKKQVNS